MFRTLKTARTLKSHSLACLHTSNLYFTSIPTRIIYSCLNGRSECRNFGSTVALWQNLEAVPKQNEFDLITLHPKTRKAIVEDLGFDKMTEVQRVVLNSNHNGDFLVRAKTGTGKTLAFMVAALEQVLSDPANIGAGVTPILVIAPTRELAMQIMVESQRLTKHHNLVVQLAVGGTNRPSSIRSIMRQCNILVGTPGRLNDLIKNEPEIRKKLQGLRVLIFDEADLLLEMGFKKEMEAITALLPKERSSYMFSATLSDQVRQVAKKMLRYGYKDVDTVPKNEGESHNKIKQSFILAPYKDHTYLLQDIIRKHKQTNPLGKIIIFLPTAFAVLFTAELLGSLPGIEVLQIHSKLTQVVRTKISDQFRKARASILVTTDVSARGVDYPGVTLVVQLGMPSSKDQYVHRIGRTGRAGNDGEAILLLSPYEQRALDELSQLPLRTELRFNASPNARDPAIVELLSKGLKNISAEDKKAAIMSMLAFRTYCD